MAELYTVVDEEMGIVSCNACGAHTLDGNPEHIKHYLNCGGLAEVEKWEEYYEDFNEGEDSD